MSKLGVNIDHVATIRQARFTKYPDPVEAGKIAVSAGADQLTVHLREDRRHIQDADLWQLRKILGVKSPSPLEGEGRGEGGLSVDLNLELAINEEIIRIALQVKPDICTFVPERRQELTTEGGLDVAGNFNHIVSAIKSLKEAGTRISMFIEPLEEQVNASKEAGATAVEFHTGKYAELADNGKNISGELSRLRSAVALAKKLGLYVAAGHGLNYDNTALIVKEIPDIVEYNIGHSIIARAIFVGLNSAVAEMKRIVG